MEEVFEIMNSGLTMLKQGQLGKKERATTMKTVAALYEAIKEGLCNHPQEPKDTGCNMDVWATSFAHRERVSEVVLALGAARDIKDQQGVLQQQGVHQERKEIKADTKAIKIAQAWPPTKESRSK